MASTTVPHEILPTSTSIPTDNLPIDPALDGYASTIEDNFSDLTSFNSSQFDDQYTPQSESASASATPSSSFAFLQTRDKVRRSWIWKYSTPATIHNKTLWQCSLCPPSRPKRYADSSTKHQIEHLRSHHRMTKFGQLSPRSSEVPNIIRQAFGNSRPRIHFNSDLFKDLLIRWMIQSNISFFQVYIPIIDIHIHYLIGK